ncbi:MAG: magnesium transporter [Desulfobacterales bacterium]|nr:magnesium transporter [Desulfobacterales bacterium]MCP4160075.1 magnesium transporter [Deltaproteobacteria bacterium]
MLKDKNNMLVDTIRRFLRRDAISHLSKIINNTHAADLSIVFRSFSIYQQLKLFNLILDIEQKADTFSELEEKDLLDLIAHIKDEDVVKILKYMPADDTTDLISKLPEERSNKLLESMNFKESEEVEELLSYGTDTAGGIMIPDYIALREDITAKEAIEALQNDYSEVEMPFYLYVSDEFEKLVGVCSLRQLVVVSPYTQLKKIMSTDIFSVRTDTDQEEVAKIVARYDILAVPVVDENNKLVGIVTVDDVIDIFRKEATEDILKMAGVGEEFVETQTILRSTKTRLPWLFASCLGGILAFFVIGQFEDTIAKYAYLAAFMPVILGMGGNIGTQSSTIVVRGIATGRINSHEIWKVVIKELTIGVILGCIYGLLIAIVANVRFYDQQFAGYLALAVGLAVLSSMSIAALVGSFVPMLFEKLHIDPAIATGPFVTTSIDIVSVFFYFSIASILLGI